MRIRATRTATQVSAPRRTAGAAQRVVDRLVRAGVPLFGAVWLEVPGRRTGVPRGVVVNVLRHDGRTFLYAPRGETGWVRNLRVAHRGTLRGREFTATEVTGAERAAVQAAYLHRWGWQVRSIVGTDPDPADHPTFEVHWGPEGIRPRG